MLKRALAYSGVVSFLAIAGTSPACGKSPTGPSLRVQRFTVTAIVPSSGVPGGATTVTVFGTGFQSGATVTIDDMRTNAVVNNSTAIIVSTPAHPAGSVDVVVTNPDGQSGRLTGGYTYADPPPLPLPIVTAITPNRGSTAGGTPLVISGTGIQSGATVTLDGVAHKTFVYGSHIYLNTLVHTAGPVDVVVTNPDAQAYTASGGYTYASPDSFDFNGDWEGGAGPEWEVPVAFTIQNNLLVSVSCGVGTSLLPSPPPVVRNGEFSLVDQDAIILNGRILAAGVAGGTINIASCMNPAAGPGWFANKK